jgi:site-specific recombinase XerD
MAMKRTVRRRTTVGFISLGEAFTGFILEKRGRNISEATLRNYEQSYEFFMEFHNLEESDSLGEIDSSMFYEWAESLKEKGVRPSSINHYLRDCRTFFYWCMNEERQYMKPFKIHEVKKQE